MKKLLLYIIAVFLINLSLKAQNCGSWTDISLPSTNLTVRSFSCSNNLIFALDNNFEIYKSSNNGISWQLCSIALPWGSVNSNINVKYAASNNTYYLGYEGNFFYSTDGGNTWDANQSNALADQLHYIYNDSIFFSFSSSYKLKLSDVNNPTINPTVVNDRKGFVQTSSNYFSWNALVFPTNLYRSATGIYNGVDITANLPVSQGFGGLAVKGDTLFVNDFQNKKYYFSIDEGNTWSLFYDYTAVGAFSTAWMVTTNDYIYIFFSTAGGTYSNIVGSNDNGNNWSTIPFYTTNTTHGVSNNRLILFGSLTTPPSMFEITGNTQSPIDLTNSTWHNAISFIHQSQNKLLIGAYDNMIVGANVHLSLDNGSTYSQVSGIYPDPNSAVLTSQILIVNNENYPAQKSLDNGVTWQNCPSNTTYMAKGDTVYGFKTGTNQKVYYSYNGGLSFDSVVVSQNYNAGACVNGGFVTHDLTGGSNFSYYNNASQTTTLFNSTFFGNNYYFKAIDFAGKKILIADDSLSVKIGYSANNFQTVQQSTVNTSNFVHPLAVYKENNNLIIAYHDGYLISTDGITFNDMSNQDACINSVLWNQNSKKFGFRYEIDTNTTSIARTYFYMQTVPQNCTAAFALVPDTIPYHYFALNQSTGSGTMNYAWNWGDGTAITTGATPSHTYAAGGFYNICLTIEDGLGCSDSNCDTSTLVRNSANAMITVNVVNWLPSYLGLSNKINNSALPEVFPNPSEGVFAFKDNKNAKTVEVFNLTGVLILSESNSKQINLSDFPKGIYIARINGEQVIKLVKE
jgi:hypothetical protein